MGESREENRGSDLDKVLSGTKKITFRPGPSFAPLEYAMKNQKKFDSMECFLRYLNETYGKVRGEIGFSYYSKGDERIGWNNVFLVVICNLPYGFVTFDEVVDGTMYNSKGEEI